MGTQSRCTKNKVNQTKRRTEKKKKIAQHGTAAVNHAVDVRCSLSVVYTALEAFPLHTRGSTDRVRCSVTDYVAHRRTLLAARRARMCVHVHMHALARRICAQSIYDRLNGAESHAHRRFTHFPYVQLLRSASASEVRLGRWPHELLVRPVILGGAARHA